MPKFTMIVPIAGAGWTCWPAVTLARLFRKLANNWELTTNATCFPKHFNWLAALDAPPPTVEVALYDLMAANGWQECCGKAQPGTGVRIVAGQTLKGGNLSKPRARLLANLGRVMGLEQQ